MDSPLQRPSRHRRNGWREQCPAQHVGNRVNGECGIGYVIHDVRSLNQQVLWLLRQGLSSAAVDPAIWKRIDKRRTRQRRA